MLQNSIADNSQSGESIIKCLEDIEKAKAELIRTTLRTTGDTQEEAIQTVTEILNQIKTQGDKAVIHYTKKFDGFSADNLFIDQEEIETAWENTPKTLQRALRKANERIKDFHQYQVPKDISIKGPYGESLGRRWQPVERAGIYIPGGRAAYPSTVLMNAIPALVAGVKEIFMVSPAAKDGKINRTVLAAAHVAGIHRIFRIGGAQAIAALAFGTESIPKVDVITGPGNLYVTLAKKLVYGKVGIDSLAGPSEVLIIADQSASAEQVASDLLAQAEHDPLAASILLTTERKLAEKLPKELKKQMENHPRGEICKASLSNWGLIVICNDIKTCLDLSDSFAPEHLELLVENPRAIAKEVHHAGAIFIGHWTPEAIGDYLAGPNHTLPTSGTARFSSALSVETFMKNTSIIEFTKDALKKTSEDVIELAKSEGLHSHSESVRIRSSIL